MLGHVARWLRLAGYDTHYAGSTAPDDEILRQAVQEQRVLLTRDQQLHARAAARGHEALLVETDSAARTLKRVFQLLRIAPEQAHWFTRCTRCNGELRPVDREHVRERVDPGIWQRNDAFHECSQCGHVYWEGTHVAQIRAALARLDAPDASS